MQIRRGFWKNILFSKTVFLWKPGLSKDRKVSVVWMYFFMTATCKKYISLTWVCGFGSKEIVDQSLYMHFFLNNCICTTESQWKPRFSNGFCKLEVFI